MRVFINPTNLLKDGLTFNEAGLLESVMDLTGASKAECIKPPDVQLVSSPPKS